MLIVAGGGNFEAGRLRVIVVNHHLNGGVCKIDLILSVQGSGWWRRDQVEERGLVAFVKVIVDGVQPDVHGLGAGKEANRIVGDPIEPIVFAQFGGTLLSVEIHHQFVSRGSRPQHAELSPKDGVLKGRGFHGIPLNKLEAHHRRRRRFIVQNDRRRLSPVRVGVVVKPFNDVGNNRFIAFVERIVDGK